MKYAWLEGGGSKAEAGGRGGGRERNTAVKKLGVSTARDEQALFSLVLARRMTSYISKDTGGIFTSGPNS